MHQPDTRRHARGRFGRLTATLLAGLVAAPVLADPPANVNIPTVFCLRLTDIVQTGFDDYEIEFEVLNWSNEPAYGLSLATTVGSTVDFAAGGADIDADGRERFGPAVPAVGNIPKTNDWTVVTSTTTQVGYSAGTPISNIDLLAIAAANPVPPGTVQDTIDAVKLVIPSFDPIADPETIDNGPNVLDGFVIGVNDWAEGGILSFNWFLMSDPGGPGGGLPIGNNFGFGVVNIGLFDPDGPIPPGVFDLNTGFNQSTATGVPGTFQGAIAPSAVPSGLVGPASFHTEFFAEVGAGITAPFADPNDQNAICGSPAGCPPNVRLALPEPSTLAIAALGIVALGWRRRCRRA